jgi:hypothetical protein
MLCLLVVLGESFLGKYNPLGFKTLAFSPIFWGLRGLTFFSLFEGNFRCLSFALYCLIRGFERIMQDESC